MIYELYYWPGIQGRGEFVRLSLEEGGAKYVDVARDPSQGAAALAKFMGNPSELHPPFAPPFLKAGKQVIGQTTNILMFLGPRLGLLPKSESGRLWAHQLELTIADWLEEVHLIHHPVAGGLYYEDQKTEAYRRAGIFRSERLPKYLGYFEEVLKRNSRAQRFILGKGISCVDLSLFQMISGLRYALPQVMARLEPSYPLLVALHEAVSSRPRTVDYLSSDRRLPFNQLGIFRHYPELDE